MTDATASTEPTAAVQTPPWEADGKTFDPERAWTLIVNLRQEVADGKAQVTALTAERDEAKTAAEAAATDAATAREQAEQRASAAERALWTERALRKHPLPEGLDEEEEADLLSFLSGDSEEAVVKKAARLESLRGGKKVEPAETGDPAPTAEEILGDRPAPALNPGHGGTPPATFDAAAIAKAARNTTR